MLLDIQSLEFLLWSSRAAAALFESSFTIYESQGVWTKHCSILSGHTCVCKSPIFLHRCSASLDTPPSPNQDQEATERLPALGEGSSL